MIHVAAAIIHQNNRILICRRGAGGNCAFLWEFPGGKLEEDETLEECIIRECKEELDINIEVKDIYAETTYEYPDKVIAFTFFNAEITNGEIKMDVHEEIKWVMQSELINYEFCPADVGIVKNLVTKV